MREIIKSKLLFNEIKDFPAQSSQVTHVNFLGSVWLRSSQRHPMTGSMDIDCILSTAFKRGASDIHLVVGEPPVIRVDTGLLRLDHPALKQEDLKKQLSSMLNDKQQTTLLDEQDVDLSWATEQSRYRVNVHVQNGTLAIAMRSVKTKIPPIQEPNRHFS